MPASGVESGSISALKTSLYMYVLNQSLVVFHLRELGTPKIVVQCRLLITFASSLDPDQARQNVGSDLGPNCLTL